METSDSAGSTVAGYSDGSSLAKRRSYTIKEKKAYIAKVDCLLKSGEAKFPHKACKDVGIDPRYYKRWKKQIETQTQLKTAPGPVPFNISYKCRKLHCGATGVLDAVKGLYLGDGVFVLHVTS